ncbi:nucleoside-diphosphate-sugar epimerase [Kribbella voronezhensis]|uniref:Nucleoside-diphosphate-sugar epimerase n=1 Tax=Kribbella voronezhensis TaxID=2512212 RepID=A0A4R7T9M8_9ACTN|nr:NAD-dependent epimerase/dehydratase family protein [Kribbella voronezhensis]TDU88692.1 nucleoside-diphosphate-sugar epimerase [Kribbella voronezhensis]
MRVVVGAGPVGTAVAKLLAEQGEQVKVVTRNGTGPEHSRIEKVAADATDATELSRIAAGAGTLFSCGGPAYGKWATDWPPLGASLIETAHTTGALLVTTGNLYGYGAPTHPMTEQDEGRPNSVKGRVRARLWADALAAHRDGRIRTAEVRGSDYLGAGAASFFTVGVLPGVLRGKATSIPADLDAPHSWTYVGDVARTLIAVAADESAWGRSWHVPTAPPLSVRELATRAAAIAGLPAPKVRSMPPAVLWLGGLVNKQAREIRELQYQFRRPFVLDSSAATEKFGIEPVGTDQALRETVIHLMATVPG